MRFRHAFCITTNHFADIFKLLLYRLVTTVILGSIAYVILRLGLSAITGSAQFAHLEEVVSGFFSALFTGESDVLRSFQSDFSGALADVLNLIESHSGSIIGCVIGIGCIYLVSRFVNGLAVFAVGGSIDSRMGTYAHSSFSQSYFKRLGSASLYQVIYVPVCFLYDAITLVACWFFFFYAPSILPSWGFLTVLVAISLTVTALICMQALKMTLISAWMPAVVTDGVGVGKAFAASIKNGKDFRSRFGGFLAGIYCVVAVNVGFAFATLGSSLLITVPGSYLYLLAMQFVNYYRSNGKRYFVSRERIAGEEAEEGGPKD